MSQPWDAPQLVVQLNARNHGNYFARIGMQNDSWPKYFGQRPGHSIDVIKSTRPTWNGEVKSMSLFWQGMMGVPPCVSCDDSFTNSLPAPPDDSI